MLPDVTGFTLGEAVGLLEAAGVTGIDIRITAPPREKERQYGPGSRVVRQIVCSASEEATKVELIVCNP